MATIEIHDGKLTVHIHGIDKLLAMRSSGARSRRSYSAFGASSALGSRSSLR